MKKVSVKTCQGTLALAALGLSIACAEAKPYGLQARPAVGPFLNNTLPERAPSISGNWSAVVAFPHLVFTNALGLAAVPGGNDLCVWEREGRIWTFDNNPGVRNKKLLLDIHDQCQGWDDSGLLGVAFAPGYATNHYIYVFYTWVKPGTVVGDPYTRPNPILPNKYHDRLSRFTVGPDGTASTNSELALIDQTDQTVWHHGGGLFFGPKDGFLYLTIGDNSVGDNDQVINKSLLGGVLRIDVDCRGGNISHPIPRQPANGVTARYCIPNNNPFVGQSNVLEEFFCLGLRSPHRMTVDPVTGRIFIGDVGESTREEVDVIEPGEKGLNFQWPYCEGKLGKMPAHYLGTSRGPIIDYPHSDGRAVIGGYVYRGQKFSKDLGGKYIFGDNVYRTIWALNETATPPKKEVLCVMPKGSGPNSGADYTGLSSFGTDAKGELYLCQMSSIGGRIYTLQRGGPPPPRHPLPTRLSETGLFKDLRKLAPQNFLIPYDVNTPLWSDGAVKSRWFVVPSGQTVTFSPTNEWAFPAGTVFVKNFSLPLNDTNPAIRRRLETRLLVRDADGTVYGACYKWRPDLSDADLVTSGITEAIAIQTPTGVRTQNWFYPGRQDCLTCHTPASGGVLGVNARQLNRDLRYPNGVTDNELRTLNHIGLFSRSFDENRISNFEKLAAITNREAPLELRVRSYLDANCSQCHRPGGAEAFFDARFDTPLKDQKLINGPVGNTFGIVGAKIVVPGNPGKSLLYQRISMVGNNQMPPLAKNVVDDYAVAVMNDWIKSLPVTEVTLPKGWSHSDIGDVTLPGDAGYVNREFNLIASGGDIWGHADAFHFAYTTLTGDGEIVARVKTLQFTDPWAKAGVMFRADLQPGAKHVLMAVTAEGNSTFQERLAAKDRCDAVTGPKAKIPYWVKLVRSGNIFTGYISPDGQNWQPVGSSTNAMPDKIYVGLALTSHNTTTLNSALLDDVAVSR